MSDSSTPPSDPTPGLAEQERDRFFELSLDVLCVANANGYFQRINAAFSQTLGWSDAEILARPFIDFVHPDDRAATLREVERQVIASEPVLQFENRYQHKDGSWRVLSWRSVPQPGGLMFATARDVTAAKQAEDALRCSEQNLAVTLNSIGDAVIATDAVRRVTRMNPVAELMTGWTQSEASGRPIDEVFRIINEETREPAVVPVNAVLASGTIQGLANHTVLISRDGTEWPIADSAAPIRDNAGRIAGAVLVFRDVTEERQFKRELQQLNADLEHRVEQRTAQLAEGERFNRATLDALSAHVAVLDATGTIVATNHAWRGFAQANDVSWQLVGEGTNYLAICDRAAAAGDADAAATALAIRQILVGGQESWVHEYACHSADKQRWFYCRVTRFPGDGAAHVVVAHENITDMKQAQQQLAAARARFETLNNVSPVAIMFFDRTGSCINVNDRWGEMSGINGQFAHGDGWLAAVHPEDRLRLSRDWAEAVRLGKNFHSEFRFLHSDGKIVWMVTQGMPVRDANGIVSGFIRVSTDLTDLKQTEHALRLLSTDLAMLRGAAFYEAVVRQLAKLVNCEMAFICRRDPALQGQLTTLAIIVDGAILPNFDYPVAGTPCEQVVNRASCVIPSGLRQKFPGDLFLIDYQIESFVGVPFIDVRGHQIGHIGVMSRRALTQPENMEAIAKLFAISVVAEMERQASERRFSDLFEFSPDAIVITNRNGIIVEANRQVAAVFGWKPAELLGHSVEVLMPTHLRADHPSLREQYMQSALPRSMGSGRNDLLGVRKDGRVFPIEISLSPMQTPDGLLVAAAVRDVTERQKVLKELQSAAEELQTANLVIEQERVHLADRVAERTAELTAANEELVRTSRFKSEFLTTMSHELRTPLNGLLGMNDLLLKTPLTDKQREFIETSNTSGRALLSLINDVLDISKIEAGKIELDLQGCDLEALTYDVITMFSHRAKEKGISLVCRLNPETCVTAMCDDTRLRQILVNLLGNALKFTTTGGVILETKCLQRNQHRIVIRFDVTDTGLGIPDDKLHRLFSPFTQVDSSTSRQFGGTGLGLSIAKRLVELMGGTIGVTSDVGVGSTFWMEVPFDLVNAEQKTAQRKQLLGGTKVLVVDRVDNERNQIADCLEDWGCLFLYVVTLREAIDTVNRAKLEGQPFAVVLADCRLSIGDEFVHLQNLARRPDLPVIGLGFSESNDMANLLHQLGLRHLLSDPVRPSALFNALSSVLSRVTLKLNSDAVADEPTTFSGHILVAEDNHINQMFVRELLKHCGCTCDVANNGNEALLALQNHRYDLVLMDCQMPEMDGFTACREIRCREAAGELSGHLPIVALTANALKSDRERCLDAGMDDYLSKPLQAAQLQKLLAKHLTARAVQPVL